MKINQTCATCRWYESYTDTTGACTNKSDPELAGFTIPECGCEAWEEKDEHHAE